MAVRRSARSESSLNSSVPGSSHPRSHRWTRSGDIGTIAGGARASARRRAGGHGWRPRGVRGPGADVPGARVSLPAQPSGGRLAGRGRRPGDLHPRLRTARQLPLRRGLVDMGVPDRPQRRSRLSLRGLGGFGSSTAPARPRRGRTRRPGSSWTRPWRRSPRSSARRCWWSKCSASPTTSRRRAARAGGHGEEPRVPGPASSCWPG